MTGHRMSHLFRDWGHVEGVAKAVDPERVGARVVEGAGNWSFVNTTHGLGVYVAFTGVVALSVNPRAFPPPRPPPSTGITMANGSGVWPGDAWVYYPGTAGVWLSFGTNAFATSATLRTGWNLCRFLPPPVAVP